MSKHGKLYKKTCTRERLWEAWREIYRNGKESKSQSTRDLVENYNSSFIKHLNKIQYDLSRGEYKFSPARGIPLKRPGKKKPRPIVLAAIPDRIIQRAILDTLLEESSINALVNTEFSFGGLKRKKVAHAIESVCKSIQDGAKFFIRTDISGFFTRIPKDDVIRTIAEHVKEEDFIDLLKNAVDVELSNAEELGHLSDIFPINGVGVAQGCSLSSLFGNIALREFDLKMNSQDIHCFRYVDDFILLGETKGSLNRSFDFAKRYLRTLGMDVYDPKIEPNKAAKGPVTKGFCFLGCSIWPGVVQPSKASIANVLEKIDSIFLESSILIDDPFLMYKKKESLSHVLSLVDNILKGWGNHYSFCNCRCLMKEIDKEVMEKINKFLNKYRFEYRKMVVKSDCDGCRLLLGVHILEKSKSNPIFKNH